MTAPRPQAHYWPEGEEPPRLADGTIDVRALCRRWDDQANHPSARDLEDGVPCG